MTERLEQQLAFLTEVDKLKTSVSAYFRAAS